MRSLQPGRNNLKHDTQSAGDRLRKHVRGPWNTRGPATSQATAAAPQVYGVSDATYS